MTPTPRRVIRTVADPAVAALFAAVLLAIVQAIVLDDPARVLAAAVPYVLALAVLIAVYATVRPGRPGRPGRGVHETATGDGFVRASGGAATLWIRAVALAGVGLSIWLLAAFVRALPGAAGQEFGFYRVKLLVTSPVGDHNTAAGLLLVALVAAAVLAARDERWSGAVIMVTLGLVASLSRGAALLLVGVAAMAWLIASTRRTAIALTAAAVIVAGGVFGAAVVLDASPPPASTGVSGPLAEAGAGPIGASILGRVDLAMRGAELGVAHPWLGVGLGGFQDHARDLPRPNDHAHQAVTHAFAEGGVVLLVVALIMPLVLVVRVWRLPSSPLRDVAALGGLGLVAHAQVEILGGRPGYEVLLALLVGLAGAGARWAVPVPRRSGVGRRLDADHHPGSP